ncbi:TPA: hypothetical protein ACH3X1_011764 [Trebouxia sp. C0004]
MATSAPKIKGDADIATEVSEAFQKHPVEIGQLSMLEVRGLQDTQLGEEACGSTMGRHTFAYDATYRRAVWLPRGQLGKDYSTLAGLVLRLLSLHATSCAPERNWSLWGQLYRKNRSRLGLLRAEKLVFVSSAAKVKQKDLRSMEEKELELLYTSVIEESFGSALADCVLVRDFP